MTTNANSPAPAIPQPAGDREAGSPPGSASRTLRERVAEAIAKQIRVDVIDLSAARAGCRINGMQEAADAAIAEIGDGPCITCPDLDAILDAAGHIPSVAELVEAVRDANSHLRYGLWAEKARADAAIAEVMKDRPSPPLWCAHILGPNDVIPTCDYADAVELCGRINATVQRHTERSPEIGMVLCIAVPAIWPHDAASHATWAAKGNSDYGVLPSPPNRGEK